MNRYLRYLLPAACMLALGCWVPIQSSAARAALRGTRPHLIG
ncbi:glycoside hydrolase [Pseudomonas sp. S37]|nr:hypothetical protein [Pseudomonas sp. S37]MBK4993424.1 glycoside hydrolase [Pseudomonas sp. S37]